MNRPTDATVLDGARARAKPLAQLRTVQSAVARKYAYAGETKSWRLGRSGVFRQKLNHQFGGLGQNSTHVLLANDVALA